VQAAAGASTITVRTFFVSTAAAAVMASALPSLQRAGRVSEDEAAQRQVESLLAQAKRPEAAQGGRVPS
jgi:hypothetical protein